MADGVTSPFLNPKFVSQYDRLYRVRCCHAAADIPEYKNHGIFFKLLSKASAEAHHCAFHCSKNIKLLISRAASHYKFHTILIIFI
jgi:hypothetical protein